MRAFLDWGLWATQGLWGPPALLALAVGSVLFLPSWARPTAHGAARAPWGWSLVLSLQRAALQLGL